MFDSKYDDYRGVVTYLRLVEGSLKVGDKVRFMKAATTHEVLEMGQFRPNMVACDALGPGQVGYIITGIKVLGNVHVGDTVTHAGNPSKEALPGYKGPDVYSRGNSAPV